MTCYGVSPQVISEPRQTANLLIMSTELKERLFPFEGEDTDYISYLESELILARGTTSTRSPRLSSPSSTDSTSDSEIGQPTDDWKFIYCSLSRRNSRTPIGRNESSSSQTAYLARVRRRQKGLRVPQWRSEMNRFTESIPSPDTWAAKKASSGFSTVASNHLALRLMLGGSGSVTHLCDDAGMETPSLMPLDNSEMVMRGCQYGRMANDCTSNGRLAVLVGKYQKLIFICYCTVLLSLGTSKTTVNWMMRRYISDSDDKNLERYRLGCLWVNRCISHLLILGWGYKSFELFLLCGL
jgi:hypothetical protein